MRHWQTLAGLGWAGLGADPPNIPLEYQSPTQSDFVGGMTGALRNIGTDWARENLSVPVAATVPLVKTALGAAANMDFSALAAAIDGQRLSPGQVQAIISTIADLVKGSLEIVGQITKGIEVVDDTAGAIPVLGAIATVVVMIASNIALGVMAPELIAATAAHVEQVLHQNLNQHCGNLVNKFAPYATGVNGQLTPADFFRHVAITYQMWKKGYRMTLAPTRGYAIEWTGGQRQPLPTPAKLPLDGAAMFVLLCGGETQGFGVTREHYQQIVAAARKDNPKIKNGVPQEVQRRMWALIKGIMSAVIDPRTKQAIGDEGLSLMPILQDLVSEYFVGVTDRGTGGWDTGLLQRLSDVVTKEYRLSYHETVTYEDTSGTTHPTASVVSRTSSCAGQEHGVGRHADLSVPLEKTIIQYNTELVRQFKNPDGSWRIKPAFGLARNPTGRLTLSPKASEDAAKGILASVGIGIESRGWLKTLLGAAAGAGGYFAARHYELGR